METHIKEVSAMKKYILFIGAMVLLALALSACAYDGRTAEEDADPDTLVEFYGVYKTTDPVTLRIWLDDEDLAHALIQAFVNRYRNVTILFEQMGNVDARANLLRDGPAGTGADVFAFPHDHVALAMHDGLIEPVPPLLQAKWERELMGSAVAAVTFDGRMHGVPKTIENIALFYNRDLWGPTAPETWEEVLAFAQHYNNPATQDWTMAWEAVVPFHNIIWLTAAGFDLFGPNNDNFRQPNFDSPEAAAGLEIYLQMRQLMDMNLDDIELATTEGRFRTGEIPLTLTGPWAIPDLLANNVDFGVARIPTIGGVQPVAFSGSIIGAVSSFSSPINRPWAYVFLDFMVSEEGAAIIYDVRNARTSRIDISEIPALADDPFLAGIAAQTPYTFPMPTIRQVEQMWTPLGEMFSFTWSDDLTIPEAQERAMETYRMLLDVAGFDTDW